MEHLKSLDTDKELANYILTVGNRISKEKLALIKETYETFPDYTIMITALEECELLKMLVQLSNAKRGIEIGVFTGASSLSILEGLPEDGMLYAFDVSKEFTDLAQKHWELNGVSKKVKLTLGPAITEMEKVLDSTVEYDFAYVDADKLNYLNYYEILLKYIKSNGFIVFDNTLWAKKVIDETDQSNITVSMRKLNKFLQQDERVTINQLNIGDGITIVRKK